VAHPITITPTILDTILGQLALHFMVAAGNDLRTARHAASRILARYDAQTEDELRLAAEVVSCSFRVLEALSEAASPDLPFSHRLRLRASAVSQSRGAHRSRRRLERLQSGHATAATAFEPAESRSNAAEPDLSRLEAANPRSPLPCASPRQRRREARRAARQQVAAVA
jgi:hypothetical protein